MQKQILFSTLVGIFLEYFDYALYGFLTPYISRSFFPFERPELALLLTWSIFAVSFVVRPFGAIVFGHFADKLGRRKVLMLTIILLSLSTIALGLLPTYQKIGILAPLALLFFRVLQGISVSTEYSGCCTYLLEFNRKRQGLFSGIITGVASFGVFSASLLVLIFNTHWRSPFIIAGIILGILGIYFRLKLPESPAFLKAKKNRKLVQAPVQTLLLKYGKFLLLGIVISTYAGILTIGIEVFLPSYLQSYFSMTHQTAIALSTVLAFLEACLVILFGVLSDIFKAKNIMVLGAILLVLFIYPFMKLFHSPSMTICFLSVAALATLVSTVDGPIGVFLVNCFPTEIRYSGFSLSYSIGAAIASFSPSLLILLQNRFQIMVLPFYLGFIALILITTLSLGNAYRLV